MKNKEQQTNGLLTKKDIDKAVQIRNIPPPLKTVTTVTTVTL